MSDYDECPLIDNTASVELGLGYALAWVYDATGRPWPVVYDARQSDPQPIATTAAEFAQLAPHELTGRLPEKYVQFRCGAPTRAGSGKPCRVRVPRPGDHCQHHLQLVAPSRPGNARPTPAGELTLFELDGPEGTR